MDFIYEPPIVAFDVDNTLLKTDFPEIIGFKDYCLSSITEIQNAGWRTIIFTCREGKYLEDIKEYFQNHGIKFDAYNDNSAIRNDEWGKLGFEDTRKLGYDILVDDKSIFYTDSLRLIKDKLIYLYDERKK